MPGDRNKPIDGKIIIAIGELNAEAKFAGLTIAKAKEIILQHLPDPSVLPADAVARITTMDDQDEAWKKVEAEQQDSLLMLGAEWGMQMFQGVSKEVPDDYVIRTADVHLEFKPKAS